jgi:acetylornithine deacetylase/succinyl-diaminopimelate desuccinylase-like protein
MDTAKTETFINSLWDDSIIPALTAYIRIPNKSPLFDPAWEGNGYMEKAVAVIESWCRAQPVKGMTFDVVSSSGRTPLIFIDIPGDSEDCVLLYGHLDKQPEMTGWRDDLGAWNPVIEGDHFYGRGSADDGYAVFSSVAAIRALQELNISHPRCVVLIEACEESGSYDLPYYIDALSQRIGDPDLVICLDSGAGNYQQLWCTTSLRGLIGGRLVVKVLSEAVHSGDASGIVPSSFRILRYLLGRLEEASTGTIIPSAFYSTIPAERLEQARQAARTLGDEVYKKFPFVGAARPVITDSAELILNKTWRPALCVTGVAGLPALEDAGNVMLPTTSVKLSLRLPPTCDVTQATDVLKALLEEDPPHRDRVHFEPDISAEGWNAPQMSPWLEDAINRASQSFFGKSSMYIGEGGSIPFMAMLGKRFPRAQFLITGVLGPNSNAHGPNEFLHLPTAKRLTCCVASVIAQQYRNKALS